MTDDDLFHRGLHFDLGTVMQRRRLLGLLAGAGAASLVGCSSGPGSTGGAAAAASSPAASSPAADGTCTEIPQ